MDWAHGLRIIIYMQIFECLVFAVIVDVLLDGGRVKGNIKEADIIIAHIQT